MRDPSNQDVLTSGQLAGRVVRYHTWPMIRKPTGAEHAHRVAMIYVELFGVPSGHVLHECLAHDYGELAAGDAPFGSKLAVPGLKERHDQVEAMGRCTLGHTQDRSVVTSEDLARIKLCDLLEMWETGKVESNMGNRYADTIVNNTLPPVSAKAIELDCLELVLRWMGRHPLNLEDAHND